MPETTRLDAIDLALMGEPYLLIQPDVDPADGGLVLKVRMSPEVGEEMAALPWMLITEIPQERNAVIRHFLDVWREQCPDGRAAIEELARHLGLEAVTWE